jgi:hypothetical protein
MALDIVEQRLIEQKEEEAKQEEIAMQEGMESGMPGM